jgi:hypothetical protein
VHAFDRAIDRLMTVPAERFEVRDPALWQLEVSVDREGADLVVAVQVRDAAGSPQSAAAVEAVLFEDDFFALATVRALSDGDGRATVRLAGAAAAKADGRRFLHVSAGARWPLVEFVQPL